MNHRFNLKSIPENVLQLLCNKAYESLKYNCFTANDTLMIRTLKQAEDARALENPPRAGLLYFDMKNSLVARLVAIHNNRVAELSIHKHETYFIDLKYLGRANNDEVGRYLGTAKRNSRIW